MLYRIDGWDYYPDNTSNPQGLTVQTNAMADGWYDNTAILTTWPGRFGGLALGFQGNSFGQTMTEAVGKRWSAGETCIIGQAVYVPAGQAPWTWGVVDAQGGNGAQFWLEFDDVGVIRLYRGGRSSTDSSGSTLIATTPAKTIHANEWNYLELRFKIDPTAGLVELRVNTVVEISYPGGTSNLMTPVLGLHVGWDSIQYQGIGGSGSGTPQVRFDDRYILDDTGTHNLSYLGNVRVNLQLATGAGDLTQMLVTGAASNWQAVIGTALSDVEYVYSPTMGNADLYTMNPNATNQNIFGVQVVGAHRQDDATQLKSHLLLKTGGTLYEGSDHELAQSYHYYRDLWELNPHTGVGWVAADLNAIQAGQKVLAG